MALYIVYCLLKLEGCSFLNTKFISYRENTKQNNAGQFIKEARHEKGYI